MATASQKQRSKLVRLRHRGTRRKIGVTSPTPITRLAHHSGSLLTKLQLTKGRKRRRKNSASYSERPRKRPKLRINGGRRRRIKTTICVKRRRKSRRARIEKGGLLARGKQEDKGPREKFNRGGNSRERAEGRRGKKGFRPLN